MLSPTTIASSTTIPITSKKAKREIILSVTPIKGATNNAPEKAAAIPIVTQKATLGLRNSINIINTKIIPEIAFFDIRFIRLSKTVDPSSQTENSKLGGRDSLMSLSNCRIFFPASVIFILSGDWTIKIAAGLPLKNAANLSSSKPSVTVAISPTLMTPPLAV